MTPDPITPDALSFIAKVERAYASLMQYAIPGEANLGGKLLFAGETDEPGRTLAVAGNIAGAATLSASANAAALRQAMRDGVIDFLVNSLDEALRILKNQIRKRQPVAVAVSAALETIVHEMLERGVLPDLLRPRHSVPAAPEPTAPEYDGFLALGAQRIESAALLTDRKLLTWLIPADYAQRPAEFDALLMEHLPPGDEFGRRWLRLSPRYLGMNTRRFRSLCCDEETAAKLMAALGPPWAP